jgi:hypothetical protein
MLADGRYRKIVASTLSEICGVMPLVDEGILDEVRASHATLVQYDEGREN